MEKPKYHILVCCSFRNSGTPQGVCAKKGSLDLLSYIESELIDRGIEQALVSGAGCLKVCEKGPILVVYPENTWYGNVTSEDIVDEILDALEEGAIATEYQIS
jgi:(2Fe-2S) ferredoxin